MRRMRVYTYHLDAEIIDELLAELASWYLLLVGGEILSEFFH